MFSSEDPSFSCLSLCWVSSVWIEIFLCWIHASGKSTNFWSVSHNSEVNTAEESRRKGKLRFPRGNLWLLWGEAQRLLGFGVRADSSAGGWCWRCLLLGFTIPSGKNMPELQQFSVFGTTSLCVCWGVCWAPLMTAAPPSMLLLLPPGIGLASLSFGVRTRTMSVEAEEDFPCLDYGGTTGERRSSVHPVPSKTHFDAPMKVCTCLLRHFSLNIRGENCCSCISVTYCMNSLTEMN